MYRGKCQRFYSVFLHWDPCLPVLPSTPSPDAVLHESGVSSVEKPTGSSEREGGVISAAASNWLQTS